MSEIKESLSRRTNDNRISEPLLVNWPSETSVAVLSSEGISLQVTPLVVGVTGMPVPSIHESVAIQPISNVPTPRLNSGLGGAPISVSFNVARNTSQSFVPRVDSRDVTALLMGKRMRLSNAPFC